MVIIDSCFSSFLISFLSFGDYIMGKISKFEEMAFLALGTDAVDVINSIGQNDIKMSEQIPKGDNKELASIGIIVTGPASQNDNILVNATLPKGWTKKSTNHYMYTDILDEKGRKRASCMYKAAFHDRDGRTTVLQRFSAGYTNDSWLDPELSKTVVPSISDSNGNVVWRGNYIPDVSEWREGPHIEYPKNRSDSYGDTEERHFYSSSDHARHISIEVLRQFCPLYFDDTKKGKSHTLYWNKEIKWPESLTRAPVGDLYNVHVAFYRRRSDSYGSGFEHVDSGHHAQFIAQDLESAKRKLDIIVGNDRGFYDRTVYTVTREDGETKFVKEAVKPQPKKKKTRENRMTFNDGCDYYYKNFDND